MPIGHDYVHTCTYILTYMYVCIHTHMHATYIHTYIYNLGIANGNGTKWNIRQETVV